MSVKYSPLCDTDLRAYLAYCFGNGSAAISVGQVNGGTDRCQRCDGCDYVAAAVDGFLRRIDNSGAQESRKLVGRGDYTGNGDCGYSGLFQEDSVPVGFRSHRVGVGNRDGDSSDNIIVKRAELDDADCTTSEAVLKDLKTRDVIEKVDDVSEKTLFNRKRREKKKNRKLRKQQVNNASVDVNDDRIPEWRRGARPVYKGAFGSCSDEVRRKLADTRAQRLIAENEASVREAQAKAESWAVSQKARRKRETLKAMQVDQKIELMRSVDVDQLKKRQQTRIMRDTEVNKVDVEKAHNSLIVTGNVPGFAETIISSGSISPSSSVSEAEVRKLHKENLDLKKQNADLVERLRGCKVGVDDDVPYSVGITVDEEGNPIGDFGDGYGGYIGTDGRFHTGINWAEYY